MGIVSGGFEDDAAISARAFGLSDFRFAQVPDVLTGLPDDQIRREVEEALPQIVDILTTAPKQSNGAVAAVDPSRPAEVEEFTGTDRLEAWEGMNASFLDRGFGDGFPLVAPTPDKVEGMVAGTTLEPSHILGAMPPGNGVATVEKLAINCVMAGCEPGQLPILIAAVESIIAHAGVGYDMSTTCRAPLLLVNGPIVKELGINSGRCTLGPGSQSKANIAIGRALRLIKMNVGFNRPGLMDMDTIGSPTKFSLCAAENEDKNPWEPFHVEKGFDSEASTVTVFDILNQKEAGDMANTSPEGVMDTISFLTSVPPIHYSYFGVEESDGYLILLSPEHANIISRAGWSKESVKRYIWRRASIPASRHSNQVKMRHEGQIADRWKELVSQPESEQEKTTLPVLETPDKYEIVVVGGEVGKTLTFSNRHFPPQEIRHRAAVG